jgi:uncharacterized repeat protein (TIGR01451 family)
VLFGAYDPAYGAAGPVGLWILEADGSVVPGTPLAVGTPGVMAAPTLDDLDSDGYLEIIAANSVGRVFVWDTPTPFIADNLIWPMARHNLQRTAFLGQAVLRPEAVPDLSSSYKAASVPAADRGEIITFTVTLSRTGPPLTSTVYVTDVIPENLEYVTGTMTATHGTVGDGSAPVLLWRGLVSDTSRVDIEYAVRVAVSSSLFASNSVEINAGPAGQLVRSIDVAINSVQLYIPALGRLR